MKGDKTGRKNKNGLPVFERRKRYRRKERRERRKEKKGEREKTKILLNP